MKTDRELLELAAKAASYKHLRYCEIHMAMVPEPEGEDLLPFSMWNPLTDDGDALRLAHALGMQLNLDECNDMNDVRTDIVLAAAAIGEQMQ